MQNACVEIFLVFSKASALCYAVESSDRFSLAEIVRLTAWRRVASTWSLFGSSKEADSMWRINVTFDLLVPLCMWKSSYWTNQKSNDTVPGEVLFSFSFFFSFESIILVLFLASFVPGGSLLPQSQARGTPGTIYGRIVSKGPNKYHAHKPYSLTRIVLLLENESTWNCLINKPEPSVP